MSGRGKRRAPHPGQRCVAGVHAAVLFLRDCGFPVYNAGYGRHAVGAVDPVIWTTARLKAVARVMGFAG